MRLIKHAGERIADTVDVCKQNDRMVSHAAAALLTGVLIYSAVPGSSK